MLGEKDDRVRVRQNHRTPKEFMGEHGPYWIICKPRSLNDGETELFTLELSGSQKILPIFGGRDGGVGFLRGMLDHVLRPELEVSRMPRARLASALRDTLMGIDRVAFDPLPEPDLAKTVRLASLCRGDFVDLVFGRGRAWSERRDHEELRDQLFRQRHEVLTQV